MESIRGRPHGQHVFRLAYSRNRYSVTGEPVLVVWLVLVDDAPDDALDLAADPKVEWMVKSKLAELEEVEGTPVYLRVQLASENGPAEELLTDGA